MHYFWFIPLVFVMIVFVWGLYLVVARSLPKTSDRSVEGALNAEREEEEAAKALAKPVTPH
jgi:hypothetical protein